MPKSVWKKLKCYVKGIRSTSNTRIGNHVGVFYLRAVPYSDIKSGHAVSMINAVQYRSMPDQNSVIDLKCGIIDRHWCQCQKFDPALIGIERH